MNLLALNWNDLKNPFAGGAEVHFEELLRRLVSQHGHTVTLVCSGWDGCADEEIHEGIRILRTGRRQNFNFAVRPLLKRLVAEESFNLLIEDINKVPFYTPLYLSLPTLVVIPHLFATTVFHEASLPLALYVYLFEVPVTRVYRRFHHNVISESTAAELVERGIPKDQVSVIHCGIDRSTYAHDPAVTKYDVPTVLYLGRIKKYKSVQHLITAFADVRMQIPEARLMVVGAGDYLGPLRKQATTLGIGDAVEFPGFVPSGNKVERLRRAHVAVLPSRKEGWGLTNIEANAVGTAVIAADTPGLRDSVRHNETGYLYPYGDTDALRDNLLRLLTDDSERQRLERGGLQWAERFNWDDAAAAFNELVEREAGRDQ